MKITIANAPAQRLLGALRMIDNHESVKLAGMTRLDIARNINRLMPGVLAFERTVGALQREIVPRLEAAEANKAIVQQIADISERTEEIDLVGLEHAALRLDDNQRITGETIAALAPVLKDFDTTADA